MLVAFAHTGVGVALSVRLVSGADIIAHAVVGAVGVRPDVILFAFVGPDGDIPSDIHGIGAGIDVIGNLTAGCREVAVVDRIVHERGKDRGRNICELFGGHTNCQRAGVSHSVILIVSSSNERGRVVQIGQINGSGCAVRSKRGRLARGVHKNDTVLDNGVQVIENRQKPVSWNGIDYGQIDWSILIDSTGIILEPVRGVASSESNRNGSVWKNGI